MDERDPKLSRRDLLLASTGIAIVGLGIPGIATAAPLELTPEAPDDDEPTPSAIEGPYYKTNSPRRASLREAKFSGTPVVVSGVVVDQQGKPIADALLDFWHCDADGGYDNATYLGRGHQLSTEEGKFRLLTIVPGEYSGRVRHIHVRVQPKNGRILTTQLFFPKEAGNARDSIFQKALEMTEKPGAKERELTFRFVVRR